MHWRDIGRRLANLGEFSITLRFSLPQVASDGGVLLRPTHGAEQYQRLRRSILGPTAREHGAHITLLHPRHSAGAIHDMAGIAPALADLTVTFRRIALIRQCGSEPWSVQREYGGAA